MGCVLRKQIATNENTKPNVFKVFNIDQHCNDGLAGEIEITVDHIWFHAENEEIQQTVKWPIRTLRRYGYDNDIFSFEAGRRCPTGEGIFGFRCEDAEQIFRLLQSYIQNNCSTTPSNHTDPNQPAGHLESRTRRMESVGSTNSQPHTPVSPQLPSTTVYNFESKDSEKKDSAATDSVDDIDDSTSNGPVYINVPPDTYAGPLCDVSYNSYVRIESRNDKNDKYYPSPLILPPNEEFCMEERPPKLEYITLELDNKPSSPVVKTPTHEDGRPLVYTPIDFQKTWALGQSTKPNIENDRGCTRRTRFNSTLPGAQSSK